MLQIINHNTNEASLLIKQFNGLNITIYGTYEEPLFKAKDIGDFLEIRNIREVIKKFNKKQRCDVSLTDAIGREQVTTFLTEQGLYKVLMRSRKPIAEKFQDWVCEVIEEIRLKGKYDLEEKLQQAKIEYQQQLQAKELELVKYKEKTYEEIEKNGHVYVIKTDGGIKVGKTKDSVDKRMRGLQTGNRNDIEVLLDFKTSNADLLEKTVHYILDRYRCNSNREFFDCDPEYIMQVVTLAGSAIDTLKSSYQTVKTDELHTKLVENMTNPKKEELMLDIKFPRYEFRAWMDANLVYDDNKLLQLSEVCSNFFGCTNVEKNLQNEVKDSIQMWIINIGLPVKPFMQNNDNYIGWMKLGLRNHGPVTTT